MQFYQRLINGQGSNIPNNRAGAHVFSKMVICKWTGMKVSHCSKNDKLSNLISQDFFHFPSINTRRFKVPQGYREENQRSNTWKTFNLFPHAEHIYGHTAWKCSMCNWNRTHIWGLGRIIWIFSSPRRHLIFILPHNLIHILSSFL